ncbi:GNAT family N-acetyltransferase [Actinopolymorpha sp. B9G3]|uniref:GNAT family N-acetyltransferase n=1 Tax=Actinopolymorpha sp. B9G3 TaxID=3158970 RepID=UPI0032D8CCB7
MMLVKLDQTHRELVHRIRRHAEEWLSDKGTDQYRRGVDPDAVRCSIDHQVDTGAFVGWCVDGEVVAVVALIEPDTELWTPEEVKEPQTYISRLLVAENHHGKGHGAALLGAVAVQVRGRGDRWIRLNCWTTNTRLHAYYEAHGFEHVRTVDIPGRMSGALFQRSVVVHLPD